MTQEPDTHTMITQLSRTHRLDATYTTEATAGTRWTLRHGVQAPALVQQLVHASPAGSGDLAGSAPGSRPAARIEAIDTLMLIDDEAARWVRRLGHDDPGDELDAATGRHIAGTGTARCLRLLGSLHPNAERCSPHESVPHPTDGVWCCPWHHIAFDVRRWWRQARVISGWDSPAYRPFATCPVCEHRGGLRINLDMQTGFCVECRTVWGPHELGVLAGHIRFENDPPGKTLAPEAS